MALSLLTQFLPQRKQAWMFFPSVYQNMFKKELKENYIDIISQEKVTAPTVSGRISKEILLAKMNKEFIKSAKFFICGSPGFMSAVKTILKELQVNSDNVYFEDFGF